LRLPDPGLRGRVAAALVLTAAVALGVAAITLLSPLERKLRTQEVRDLVTAAVQSRSSFAELDTSNRHDFAARLHARVRRIASITGARVALLDANRQVLASTDPDAHDGFRDVVPALNTDRAVRRIVGGGSVPEARVAERVDIEGGRYVLTLRKPLSEERSAVVQVQRAFSTAAAVALAVSLLLAGFFAATVGRRLRALRSAVGRYRLGAPPTEIPVTRAGDEVGDLSRAFRAMANRLRREEDVRREFVATASHELRTPLMALQGRLEILEEDLSQREPDLLESRRQLADARDQADRLGRLAADLLDLSRLDADVALRSETVDLAELMRAVVAEFATRLGDEDNRLQLDTDAVYARADPSACARIVRVLVDNALRYSPPDRPVEVDVASEGLDAVIRVRDRGAGIPEADRDRIFTRFARGSGSTPAGGFGLGLAIARELSERMGGKLLLAETGPTGSLFEVRLPTAVPNAIPTEASPA
jgi:signal transduction histidine kinase